MSIAKRKCMRKIKQGGNMDREGREKRGGKEKGTGQGT